MFQILGAAEAELLDLSDRYNIERPGLGDQFLSNVERAFARIRATPQFCGRLETFVGPYEIRRVLVHKFPYLIVYHCVGEVVTIIAVSHASRDQRHWMDRLP